MRHIVLLSAALAAIWLLNSGHYTPLILALGALSIALVVYIAHIMDLVDHEAMPVSLRLKFPLYILWLVKEIIVSNLELVRIVWLQPNSINPVVGSLKLSQRSDLGRVIYANSITLTPGTVTLELEEDQLTIHALTEKGFAELEKGEMDRRVKEIEG